MKNPTEYDGVRQQSGAYNVLLSSHSQLLVAQWRNGARFGNFFSRSAPSANVHCNLRNNLAC